MDIRELAKKATRRMGANVVPMQSSIAMVTGNNKLYVNLYAGSPGTGVRVSTPACSRIGNIDVRMNADGNVVLAYTHHVPGIMLIKDMAPFIDAAIDEWFKLYGVTKPELISQDIINIDERSLNTYVYPAENFYNAITVLQRDNRWIAYIGNTNIAFGGYVDGKATVHAKRLNLSGEYLPAWVDYVEKRAQHIYVADYGDAEELMAVDQLPTNWYLNYDDSVQKVFSAELSFYNRNGRFGAMRHHGTAKPGMISVLVDGMYQCAAIVTENWIVVPVVACPSMKVAHDCMSTWELMCVLAKRDIRE